MHQNFERERHAEVAGAQRTREDEKWRMDQRRVAVARDAPEERPASGRWIGLVVCRRRRLHSWLNHNLNPLQRQEFALKNILSVITIDSTTTTVRRGATAEHEAGTSHGMVRGEGAAGRRARVAPLSCSLHAPRPGWPCGCLSWRGQRRKLRRRRRSLRRWRRRRRRRRSRLMRRRRRRL